MELGKKLDIGEIARIQDGSLKKQLFLKRLSDMVDGLIRIHQSNCLHRDIKPENLLLLQDGERLKFIDFGVSSALVRYTRTAQIATPAFEAPEVAENSQSMYGQKADIFSMACTADCMWSARESIFDSDGNMRTSFAETDTLADIPKEVKELLLRALDQNPFNRPQLKEIRKTLDLLIQ
mmetsp:Transcript_69084/g.104146  ORF Transcript_69084/g.104146 Transcript_69084/m.104146 type:complete len:179 (-) Transcript_69084:15-551(-)